MRYITLLFLAFSTMLSAQTRIYKDTVFNLAFGSNYQFLGTRFLDFGEYEKQDSDCPDDGKFAFLPSSPGCFSNGWVKMNEDHTPGDKQGNFMLVNANFNPGDFMSIPLRQLKASSNYEISFWLANILQETQNCEPLQPNIELRIETRNGKPLTYSKTGIIPWKQNPLWRRYSITFSTGSNPEPLVIRFRNSQTGGCGNDFAMDDVLLVEWEEELPKIKSTPPAPIVQAAKQAIKKPAPKEKVQAAPAVKPDTTASVKNKGKAEKTRPTQPINQRRDNLIQSVELPAGTIELCFFDDSKIDGDTISVYHNGLPIIKQAGLSKKPHCFSFNLSEEEPIHEVITVAETQGNMPPNTALLEVIFQRKRLQFLLHSDESQNARMQFKLKKP